MVNVETRDRSHSKRQMTDDRGEQKHEILISRRVAENADLFSLRLCGALASSGEPRDKLGTGGRETKVWTCGGAGARRP
jgi:hypothetical protein